MRTKIWVGCTKAIANIPLSLSARSAVAGLAWCAFPVGAYSTQVSEPIHVYDVVAKSDPQPLNYGGWFSVDDYPDEAIKAGHVGRVEYALAVSADGRVTGCTIALSSGYAELDAATCTVIRRRARFAPARDKDFKPIEGVYTGAMNWRL